MARHLSDVPYQIENIFCHEINPDEIQLFLRLTPTMQLPMKDAVLGCNVLKVLPEKKVIIGLPAI